MKHRNQALKYSAKLVQESASPKSGGRALAVGVALAIGAPVAWACATAYDAIIAAVDWGDVITGIAAIAALVAAVLVVMRGSKMLLRMIGR